MLHIFHGFSPSFLPSFLTPPWLQSYLLLHWLRTTASGAPWGGQFLPRNRSPHLPPTPLKKALRVVLGWLSQWRIPPRIRHLDSSTQALFHHRSHIIHGLHTRSWWPTVISYKLKVLWPTALFLMWPWRNRFIADCRLLSWANPVWYTL